MSPSLLGALEFFVGTMILVVLAGVLYLPLVLNKERLRRMVRRVIGY